MCVCEHLTLCSDQNQRNLCSVAVVGHAAVVVVHSLEADLILQTEHKDDSVHPQGKLGEEREGEGRGIETIDDIIRRQTMSWEPHCTRN